MLVKASVARSPNQLAQHVRQKVLVAAVARGVPTINDLLKRADEDKSGALSYKEFYTTLRKLLQLTAAAVTDDAVRQTFKVIDKTGDGALSREAARSSSMALQLCLSSGVASSAASTGSKSVSCAHELVGSNALSADFSSAGNLEGPASACAGAREG